MKFSLPRPRFPGQGSLATVAMLGFLVLAAQFLAEWQILDLRFERGAILNGQWWRLVSGHLLHLGWIHALINLTALVLIIMILEPPRFGWLLAAFVCSLGCGLGLLIFEPNLTWYVGLSGVLHGLVIVGLVCGRWLVTTWLILLAIIAKLTFEQVTGGSRVSELLIGGPVAVDAHLWGAMAGVCWALLLRLFSGPSSYNPVALKGTKTET